MTRPEILRLATRPNAKPSVLAVWLAALWLSLSGPALAQVPGESAASAAPSPEAPPAAAPPPAAPPVVMPTPAQAVMPAQMPSASTEWQALSPAHKQLLAPLEKEWNGLDPSRRGKWLELAARYPQLPEDEQQRVHQRMSDWAKLSPAERQQARLTFQAARQLKADERQAKWEAYQALPEEKRQLLADKAAQKAKPAGVPPPDTANKASAKAAPAAVKPSLVLLRPNQSDQPLGPTVLQAKPGATTVLINQGRFASSQTRQPTGNPKLALDLSRLDAKTLLPKPDAAPARQ